MRRVIFISVSVLVVALMAAIIPSSNVTAQLASPPLSPTPQPAQQEEEALREDILIELNQAKQYTDDPEIIEYLDAIINRVRNLQWVELSASAKDALAAKHSIAKLIEQLINELPLASAGATTAAAAPVGNPLYEELVKIRAKIEKLIELETPPEEVPPPPPEISRLPETERLIMYSAKFLCGPAFSGEGVQRGSYSTAINVHNPHNGAVYLYKKAVIANREDESRGKISAFRRVKLGPDEAIEIDCIDIVDLVGSQQDLTRLTSSSQEGSVGLTTPSLASSSIRSLANSIRFIKGFVVIYATAPLDVVAVYTASTTVGFSIDVEYLSQSMVTALPLAPPPEELVCPQGCRCLTKKEAVEVGYTALCQEDTKICGQDEDGDYRYCFTKPTAEVCPDTCVCLEQVKALELDYPLCQGRRIVCGRDDQQQEMLCYERPTEEKCPQGCRCFTKAEADELGYTWCQGQVMDCGEDPVTGDKKYCFEKEYECPDKCECLEQGYASKYGYVLCNGQEMKCGTDASGAYMYCYEKPEVVRCPDDCACKTEKEAERLGLAPCPGESRVCGYQNGERMYCYQLPSEEEECPPGCVCLTELEAKRGNYTWCGGKQMPCGYEPGAPERWCYEIAVPGKIAIEPSQDANPIGTPHTVTITVYDMYGKPMANANVNVNVNGANSYASGTVTTNSSGKATFEYSGKNVGSDTIVATVDKLSATAFKEWYRR